MIQLIWPKERKVHGLERRRPPLKSLTQLETSDGVTLFYLGVSFSRAQEFSMTDLSVDARLLASERGAAPPINTWVVILASAVLGSGAIALGEAYSWRQGALFLVGGGLGIALYHALFGFTSAWRVFIADGRGAGLRAQMLMLAVGAVLFFPALGHGTLFGQPVHGEYGAVGVSVMVGAFCSGSACSSAAAAPRARSIPPAAATRACW